MKKWRIVSLCVLLCSIASACASGGEQPGGSFLYNDAGELLDSEIRLETYRPGRVLREPDTRRLRVIDGQATGEVATRSKTGQGPISLDAFGKLWSTLRSGGALLMEREAPKQDGGLYHVVRLRRGTEISEFSAQEATNSFGIGTRSIYDRLELVNAIARTVADQVPTSRRDPSDDTAPGTAGDSNSAPKDDKTP